MDPLIALLLASAACALARPPDMVPTPMTKSGIMQRLREQQVENLRELLLPRYLGYDDSPRLLEPPLPDYDSRIDWLSKEINHLNGVIDTEEDNDNYNILYPKHDIDLMPRNIMQPIQYGAIYHEGGEFLVQPLVLPPRSTKGTPLSEENNNEEKPNEDNKDYEDSKIFALTPKDKGYFDNVLTTAEIPVNAEPLISYQEGNTLKPVRQIRQNPNLSKTKNLVADNLEILKSSASNGNNDNQSDTAKQIHVLGTHSIEDPTSSMYGVALVAAVGAALTLAVFGFAFGWYTISKRAKSAADVDYPAYGVTGPTLDTSGDRKLAQSAHMYHYQHQKQQIIAMERNGAEQRNGSVSDPESEEENEEGDYTVYECPGFATTGEMEVKNPLFSDDPTPATPGKCEVVKPQPKE